MCGSMESCMYGGAWRRAGCRGLRLFLLPQAVFNLPSVVDHMPHSTAHKVPRLPALPAARANRRDFAANGGGQAGDNRGASAALLNAQSAFFVVLELPSKG